MAVESSRRSRRAFIWMATGLAVAVVAASFALSDGVLAGAVAATRNTARFSGLVLAAALVARAPRPVAPSRWRTELTLAFVAAHGVHYASVVLRALVEPSSKLRSFSWEVVLVILAGVVLLAVVAATARPTSRVGRRTNGVAFYVAWTVLALGSASHAPSHLASAVVLGALITAMAWRIGSRFAEGRVAPSV